MAHDVRFWGVRGSIATSREQTRGVGGNTACVEVRLGETRLVEAAILAIPVVLFARFTSVSLPVLSLSPWRRFTRGVIPILTWSGLRGGISVALVLSLAPRLPVEAGNLFLLSTYFVVLFSVIVQGLTVRPLLRRYLGA